MRLFLERQETGVTFHGVAQCLQTLVTEHAPAQAGSALAWNEVSLPSRLLSELQSLMELSQDLL